MQYELVYDAVTTSEAPRNVLVWVLGLTAIALAWGGWLRARGHALHGGVKMLGIMAGLLFAVFVLGLVEQRVIARRDTKIVEGPIVGLWQKAERTRDADRKWRTTHWEGFWVNGVPFVYAQNVDQNYFHNGGSRELALKDGMRVRVHYQLVRGGNEIVRFERATE